MAIKQECISIDSPSEWRKSLEGIEHAFAHTWESCYAMQLTSGMDTYLYCFEMGDVRVICPISERRFQGFVDIVTPYGFSGFAGNKDCSDFPRYWTDFVEQRGYICGYIGLNPLFENGTYIETAEVYRNNEIYALDLTLSTDELFANLSQNRKLQLKNWDKILPNLVHEKHTLKNFFLANYRDFFRKRNASKVYSFSVDTISSLFGLDNVLVVGAQDAGEVEAVSVFGYTPYGGDFLFNVSLPQGQHHSATLLWYGVNRLKSLGIPMLNLGGGVHKNDGVACFKQRFGGRSLTLGCLKQIYEQDIYRKLCQRVNADHTDLAGYFPPYRKP
jgi:hypothetical protein